MMVMRDIALILLSYLSGSVLYAHVFGRLFSMDDRYQESDDQNPGTINAFKLGGFWCGTLTLLGDLLKGLLPVWLCRYLAPNMPMGAAALVIAAPVVGHVLPAFHHFQGGKGIATTFGCLLGLLPDAQPIFLFAAAFILFSTVCQISPNFYRTIAAYLCTLSALALTHADMAATAAFLIMTVFVCAKLHASKEARGKVEVKLMRIR